MRFSQQPLMSIPWSYPWHPTYLLEKVLIDFHRLLGLGVAKLNSPKFDGRLQLLPEHLALICTV
jgi:hypothetical protein